MIRVFVSASSAVAEAGLKALLAGVPGVELAPSLEAADMAVTDEEERAGELPFVLLSARAAIASVEDFFASGGRALLPSDTSAEELAAAVRAVAAGLVVLHPAALATHASASLQTGSEPLTPREVDVLRMMAEGDGNKSIAWKLGISEHTVKFHVASILGKLSARSRTEAVTQGIRRGLVPI